MARVVISRRTGLLLAAVGVGVSTAAVIRALNPQPEPPGVARVS